ncbi:hypothetical protein CONLIGDRAFT_579063 [Coniochaeta ligniaria NRRL 30616]|uniref:DUF8004 domain-containing protein n=1 Tax=Coniochaeta ligniaria NRRL 30616 TaxID=1408157 RepID=A0A1J7JEK3_9PEZI|nr:hypothetical protein CONLIGDRAFT_579063 [Coniochaeta ligniaria NRRL 30616]
MSGRSAYVRKKITETKPGEKGAVPRSRAKSVASSEDNATISDYPMPGSRQDTGVATTNARFLKFSEPVRETEILHYRSEVTSYGNQSSGSLSGGSVDGRRDVTGAPHFRGPLEDFAYARARRPVIKTEDVSGIEKSGLRNMLDKKSDEVRKGLAKTFAFRKKDKKGADLDRSPEFRPQSSATVRPGHGAGSSGPSGGYPSDADLGHDAYSPETLPVQYSNPQNAMEQPWDSSGMMAPPPASKLPNIPTTASAPPIKRWIGAGRPIQRWNKLRKDPELWDPNGDVLVFFGQRGQSPRPNPSFRLSSHIIEATESRYLITLLREGSTEEDIHMPPSPMGAPPMLQRHGHYAHPHLSPHNGGYSRGGQPTPPISEDVSLGEADGQISYEMYFPTPPNVSKVDQLRHHITTRNVFALLYHASLVGLSLYQALFDLHSRLETYMPPEADNVGIILNYLSARGIDDVRNDPETAVSLLAWSEGSEVRWEEGWRESFLHCAGMYSRLESCADFKHITPITRALLERACLETQLRVQAAEERLAEFQFGDMWPASVATTASSSGPVTSSPAKGAADRLQKFLVQHYAQVFGEWPPLPASQGQDSLALGTAHGGGDNDEDTWLSRTVAQSLQKDFAALYDYLVNRDIVWDGSEARSSRKWMMVSESGNRGFEADTPDLPMTDMLIEFDNKLRFPHIPHPYSLVPESLPPLVNNSSVSGKDSPSGGGISNAGNGRSGAMERRIQLAYTEATNICLLGSEFTHSDLIDAFSKFEKTDRVGEVDPSVARRGRWVLIYGILQTLASVSVDAPNVRYREDVGYHLSPRLKGAKMPPWKTGGPQHTSSKHNPNQSVMGGRDEAAHELSHCWTVPHTWNQGTSGTSGSSAANSGAESSADELSGRSPITRSYSFPRPPGSTAGRSSVAGYHTPAGTGARSVISSTASNCPPFSSAGSVISESDAASSVRTPNSSLSRKGTSSGTSRLRRDGGGVGMPRGIERVEEHDREWSARGESYPTTSSSNASVSGMGSYQQYQLAPLKVPVNFTRPGGFLMLDDVVDEQHAGTFGRPHLSGNGSETESIAPVIRDFDDLDMIDDHRM